MRLFLGKEKKRPASTGPSSFIKTSTAYVTNFWARTLALPRVLRERQPPVDLPGGVHVTLAVFVNLGELAGAEHGWLRKLGSVLRDVVADARAYCRRA